MRLGDEALAEGDFFDASDLEALAPLDGLDELRRLDQRIVGAGVEPGMAAAQMLDRQFAALEITAV